MECSIDLESILLYLFQPQHLPHFTLHVLLALTWVKLARYLLQHLPYSTEGGSCLPCIDNISSCLLRFWSGNLLYPYWFWDVVVHFTLPGIHMHLIGLQSVRMIRLMLILFLLDLLLFEDFLLAGESCMANMEGSTIWNPFLPPLQTITYPSLHCGALCHIMSKKCWRGYGK